MSRLYIVSTPIGNLNDITYRAVQVLGAVHRVLAEDTRRTSILLRHYSIATPLVSAHAHNEEGRAQQIVEWLNAGEDLAIVSDAGTPLVSDPGARIVRRVLQAGHEVVPVPGASATLAALVASGLEAEPFTFFGFVERSGKERTARLAKIAALEHTAILYEAPTRLVRLLQDLVKLCGAERQVVVARELTKLHESYFRGTLADAVRYYENGRVRGEIVVAVGGRAEESATEEQAGEVRAFAADLLRSGARPSSVAREVARHFSLPRNQAYEIALSLTGDGEGEASS